MPHMSHPRPQRVGPSPAEVLASLAPACGLAVAPEPFVGEGAWPLTSEGLRERLARDPFLMAPMAGVSDAAYRLMARCGGAALAYTEMVSVAGIHYRSANTWELVEPDAAEPEIAAQLFGSEPEQFREAVAQVCERLGERLALIDINMACPVPKVTRKGEGSALLDDPERAAEIVRACRAESTVPVTVKIRVGRVPDRIVGPEFARAMEAAGAAAVAVHGRTASQMYRGEANRGLIADVVRAVDVPVIASGDALDASRACELLRETGAAGCFIARGTYGNPWVFRDARELLAGQEVPARTPEERLAAFSLHVRLLEATGAHIARARSLAAWFLKGLPNAAQWRERAMHCQTADDYVALARSAYATELA